MSRFDRVAAVEVGPRSAASILRVEGLRIAFTIRKDRTKTLNTCEITISNLKEASRDLIRKLDQLVLYAGYASEGGPEVLFAGEIVDAYHTFKAPGWDTVLRVNDGGGATRRARVNLSYAEGTSSGKVLKDLLKSLGDAGLPTKFLATFQDSPLLSGFSFAGQTKDALDQMTRRLGLEYSIQNEQLKVTLPGQTDGQKELLVSPDTGMIGSPERKIKQDAQGVQNALKTGWVVTSLLLPKVEPMGRLAVQSRELPKATSFAVETVEHVGDTYGEDWKTTVHLLDPGAPV